MAKTISPPDVVTFLGLGAMGVHMANALATNGFTVRGWTRSGRVEDHDVSFELRHDLNSAVEGANVVILCVRDDVAVREVLFESGLSERLHPGTIVIDMGTSGIESAKDSARALAAVGIAYLDAPVSGGTQGAKDARLSIFVGGFEAHFALARSVLCAMGTPYLMGPTGAGQAAKLANQIIVGVTIAAVSEGLAFAESQGVNGCDLLRALDGGFASSTVLRVHGPKMSARDYTAAGALRLHLKDLRLAERSLDLEGLPHASLVKKGFEYLTREGKEGLDHSAYASLYQR